MINLILKYGVRFLIIILLQTLILKRVNFGWENFNYVSILFYPILILLLPLKTPKTVLLLIGFALGLIIDIFYDSLGVHASACVFTAFIRPLLLQLIEPRGGYSINVSPTKFHFGTRWFLLYSGIALFLHLLFYFSIEVFTFVYFLEIWLKTIFSFIFSFLTVLLYIFLLNPKD